MDSSDREKWVPGAFPFPIEALMATAGPKINTISQVKTTIAQEKLSPRHYRLFPPVHMVLQPRTSIVGSSWRFLGQMHSTTAG